MVVCLFAFFLPQLHGRRKHRAHSIEHHVGNGRVAKLRGFIGYIFDTMLLMQSVDVACHGHGRVVANCVTSCGFLCGADCDVGCRVAIATRGDWCCTHYFFFIYYNKKKKLCPFVVPFFLNSKVRKSSIVYRKGRSKSSCDLCRRVVEQCVWLRDLDTVYIPLVKKVQSCLIFFLLVLLQKC